MANSENDLREKIIEFNDTINSLIASSNCLHSLLEKMKEFLIMVDRPCQSMVLEPAMKTLGSKDLLHHADANVRAAVASCVCEISRICALKNAYFANPLKLFHDHGIQFIKKLVFEKNYLGRTKWILCSVEKGLLKPPVKCFLDIYPISSHPLHRAINHPNIINVYKESSFLNIPNHFIAFVEPFENVLEDYLDDITKNQEVSNALVTNLGVVLWDKFSDIVSQILSVFHSLHEISAYHGNFLFRSTYVCSIATTTTTSKTIVKLAHFKHHEGKTVEELQAKDYRDLGTALLDYHISLKKYFTDESIIYEGSHLKQVASLLANVKELYHINGEEVFARQVIKDRVSMLTFFWDQDKRIQYIIDNVPDFLDDEDYKCRLNNSLEKYFTNKKFKKDWTMGFPNKFLISDMDNYREKIGMNRYCKTDKIDFVRCLSGIYKHYYSLNYTITLKRFDLKIYGKYVKLWMHMRCAEKKIQDIL